MKRFPKKLWNGPTAIGESESRAMELTDLPYMTISSGEFMSRKRGMFREVTKRATEPTLPTTSFRASLWMAWTAPDMIARTLYNADKPDYYEYPVGAQLALDGSVRVVFKPGRPAKVRLGQPAFYRQADWFTEDRTMRVAWVAQGRYVRTALWQDPDRWASSTRQGNEGVGMTGRRREPDRLGIGWYMIGHNIRSSWAFGQSVWVNADKYPAPFYVVAACIVEINQVKYVKALGSSPTAVNSAWNTGGVVGSPDRMGLMDLATGTWTVFNLVYNDDGIAMPFGGAYAFNQSGTVAVMTTAQTFGNANGTFPPEEERRSLFAFTVNVDNAGVATRARLTIGEGSISYTSFPIPDDWSMSADPKAPVGSVREANGEVEETYLGGWLDWVGDQMVVAKLKYVLETARKEEVANWEYSYGPYLNRHAYAKFTSTYQLTVGTNVVATTQSVADRTQLFGAYPTEVSAGTTMAFTPIDLRRGVWWVSRRYTEQETTEPPDGGTVVNSREETAGGDLYIDGTIVHSAADKAAGNVTEIARTAFDADGAVNHFNGDVFVAVYEFGRRASTNHDGRSSELIYIGADGLRVLESSTNCYHGITLDMQ